MKLKLSEWANIAEIISGIGVVITLVVLVFGIRENTETVRASVYANSIETLNRSQDVILSDPDAMRVWTAFVDGNAIGLDRLDEQRLNMMVLNHFRNYENAYFSEQYGLLGGEESERFERTTCVFFGLAQSADREEILQTVMTSSFMKYMVDVCGG